MKLTLLRTTTIAAAIALAGTVSFSPPAWAEAPFAFQSTQGKLPKEIIPLHYAAHLTPDMAGRRFSGTETITLKVVKASNKIVLNAHNLSIDSAQLKGKDGLLMPLKAELSKQVLSFTLPQEIAPGEYELTLAFQGKINTTGEGLFSMDYKVDGQNKTMLATLMQPTFARAMLPLWDEPAFRSTFQLSVDIPGNLQAYSNTPVAKQEKLANGMQRVQFGVTPKMSGYLLALVVGETERVSSMQDGVDVGIITTAGKKESAAFALQSSKDLLHYYNQYFGVPYPLPKLDQIAIPGGYHGAMENWGAVIYNEATLLFDPKKSPESTKKSTFSINAHEISHMWFGDLVTMAWWDNLWINEGFASWIAAKATAHFHPEWHSKLGDLAEREGVMARDSRPTTHPIQTPVENDEQARGAFNSVTYVKSQAFLRMLESYLGEDVFQRGMRAYIKQHQYSNTTSADLWRAMETASGKPVGKLARDWTTQPGFPLVTVAQSCENGKRKVTLSQQQFRSDRSEPLKITWQIPVEMSTIGGHAGAKATYVLLDSASKTFTLPSCQGTLVVDPNSVGYYRVQYDQAGFAALAKQASSMSDDGRLKLLVDAWALVSKEQMPMASYLQLVQQMKNEPRAIIWETMLTKLSGATKLLQGTPEQAQMQRYIRDVAQAKFQQLGWEEKAGETVEEKQLRTQLALILAENGDQAAIARAKQQFKRFVADPVSVPKESIDFVMQIAGRHADNEIYESLLTLLKNGKTTEEKHRYLLALASASDPKLAARSLPLALSGELSSEMALMVAPMVAQDQHNALAWEFVTKNAAALAKIIPAEMLHMEFGGVMGGSGDASDADRLEAYAKQNLGADAMPELKRIAAGIRARAQRKLLMLAQVKAALPAGEAVVK